MCAIFDYYLEGDDAAYRTRQTQEPKKHAFCRTTVCRVRYAAGTRVQKTYILCDHCLPRMVRGDPTHQYRHYQGGRAINTSEHEKQAKTQNSNFCKKMADSLYSPPKLYILTNARHIINIDGGCGNTPSRPNQL